MLKMMFAPTPGWIKGVERGGVDAQAVVLSDPGKLIQGIGGYQGRDGWVDVDVEVHPVEGEIFQGKMKSRFSTAIGGMLATGLTVNVRYDLKDNKRILLMDDVNKLLSYRARK